MTNETISDLIYLQRFDVSRNYVDCDVDMGSVGQSLKVHPLPQCI